MKDVIIDYIINYIILPWLRFNHKLGLCCDIQINLILKYDYTLLLPACNTYKIKRAIMLTRNKGWLAGNPNKDEKSIIAIKKRLQNNT